MREAFRSTSVRPTVFFAIFFISFTCRAPSPSPSVSAASDVRAPLRLLGVEEEALSWAADAEEVDGFEFEGTRDEMRETITALMTPESKS